jgi:hypothetical protein
MLLYLGPILSYLSYCLSFSSLVYIAIGIIIQFTAGNYFHQKYNSYLYGNPNEKIDDLPVPGVIHNEMAYIMSMANVSLMKEEDKKYIQEKYKKYNQLLRTYGLFSNLFFLIEFSLYLIGFGKFVTFILTTSANLFLSFPGFLFDFF